MVVFSSSPYFEQIYKVLTKAGFKIDFLVTECPKPAGRGLKICPNPAQIFAEKIKLPIIVNLKLFPQYKIRNTKYDLGLVFAYGQIIPNKLIDKFKYGILNVHPSLLPLYRGPTPLQTTLLNDDRETGFTIIRICAKCDAGDIVFRQKIKIDSEDNFDSLMKKVMDRAIRILPDVCQKYISGEIRLKNQGKSGATYTKKLNKSAGLISKGDSAQTALNKIRAFSAWPKAYFEINGQRIIVHSAKVENSKLIIDEIQLAGKNKVKFSEFKNGHADLLTKMPNFVKV